MAECGSATTTANSTYSVILTQFTPSKVADISSLEGHIKTTAVFIIPTQGNQLHKTTPALFGYSRFGSSLPATIERRDHDSHLTGLTKSVIQAFVPDYVHVICSCVDVCTQANPC